MTLQEYIDGLQEFLNENPKLKDATVIYAKDEEGNGYHEVGYSPSHGYFDGDYGGDFIQFTDQESWDEYGLDDEDVNSVCIN